jgi:hypothetical protein
VTHHDIIRAALPKASDGLCEHILWSRTPYPCARSTPRELYRAASQIRRAASHGRSLCDFCERLAIDGGWCCEQCKAMIKNVNV